jgi:hypothetical protein
MENGNGMATVRIALALAGLLGIGTVLADGNVSSSKPKATAAPKAVQKSAKPADKKASSKADAKQEAVPGGMQVEEPDASSFRKTAAPASAARESKAWQKSHARGGLTEAQKQAFRERKEKMEGWIAVIKEKRKALAAAKPEERAAIARELHTLMLEKDPGNAAGVAARVSADNASASGDKQDGLGADGPNSVKKDDAQKQSDARKEEVRKIQSERYKTGGTGSYRGNRDDD